MRPPPSLQFKNNSINAAHFSSAIKLLPSLVFSGYAITAIQVAGHHEVGPVRIIKITSALLGLICWLISPAGYAKDSPSKQLLASELVLDTQIGGHHFSIWIDPRFSKAPLLVRKLRQANKPLRQHEPCPTTAYCYVAYKADALAYRGRLISGIGTVTRYDGGAHPVPEISSILFDLKSQTFLQFSSLFSNWPKAAETLQKQWCSAMQAHSDCPPFEHQALTLVGGYDGISQIRVETDPYAFGTYAEGTDSADLAVTKALISLIKPEYRQLFRPQAE